MRYYRARKPGPTSRRKTYAIEEQQPDGRWAVLHREDIDLVNKSLLDGTTPPHIAEAKIHEILKRLYAKRDLETKTKTFHAENQRLLEKYWTEVYPQRRQRRLVAPEAAYGDLRRAVTAVGALPLDTCDIGELQDHIDDQFEHNPRKQRRVCTWLNMLLKWLGREGRLEKLRLDRQTIRHLTEGELLEATSKSSSDIFVLLCKAAWYSGMRKGELFAVRPEDVRGHTVQVRGQIDRNAKERSTKTNEARTAFIIPGGEGILKEWAALSQEDKMAIRFIKHAKKVTNMCQEAWVSDVNKHCSFHDLRHSYAIHLLSKGIPLSHVAKSMGNSEAVCERYYVGYVLTDAAIDLMQMILNKPK